MSTNIVKLCAESTQGQKSNIKTMEKTTLTAGAYVALGINQDADAEAISQAIVTLQANYAAANDRAEALQKEIDAVKKKRAEDMVALAITEGRIGADVREDYVKLALQDYSLAEKTLRAIPAKVSLAASVTKIGDALIPADRQGWTYLHWLKDDRRTGEDQGREPRSVRGDQESTQLITNSEQYAYQQRSMD